MPTTVYLNQDKRRVPGVTTVISNLGWNRQALMYWAWKQGIDGKNFRDTSADAADAGTLGHHMIECEIKGERPDVTGYTTGQIEAAESCYLNFLQWQQMVGLEVHVTEIHLVSEKFQCGGTPDAIAIINGKWSLLDFKTGKGPFPDMLLQLAAYRAFWEELNPQHPLTGGYHLLRIAKESASFHQHYWQDLSVPLKAFGLARELHELHKEIKKLL